MKIKALHSSPLLLFALHSSSEHLFFWVVAIRQYQYIEERTDRVTNAAFEVLFRAMDWLCLLRWVGLLLWGELSEVLRLCSVG